jgi:hypothetical protein
LIDKLYWQAIRKLIVPERRHFHHATGLEEVIRCKLLDKEMINMPLTPEDRALIERIFDTWTEAGYGFTFEPDTPAPRQPPPPPPGASPEEAAFTSAIGIESPTMTPTCRPSSPGTGFWTMSRLTRMTTIAEWWVLVRTLWLARVWRAAWRLW